MNIQTPNIWNKNTYNKFINELKNNSEQKYSEFNSKLIPNTKNIILGIRIPILRDLAKKIYKTNYIDFLNIVNNKYMEEVLLEGFVIGLIKEECIADNYIKRFISKVDNWCVCDTFCSSLKIVRKHQEKYFDYFTTKINFNEPLQIRVGLVILNAHYINEEYIKRIFNYVNKINSKDYYVEMGIAWLISTCYIKFRNETLEFLYNNNLNDFTYNKAIQKIIESNRISKDEKEVLRKLKRK